MGLSWADFDDIDQKLQKEGQSYEKICDILDKEIVKSQNKIYDQPEWIKAIRLPQNYDIITFTTKNEDLKDSKRIAFPDVIIEVIMKMAVGNKCSNLKEMMKYYKIPLISYFHNKRQIEIRLKKNDTKKQYKIKIIMNKITELVRLSAYIIQRDKEKFFSSNILKQIC